MIILLANSSYVPPSEKNPKALASCILCPVKVGSFLVAGVSNGTIKASLPFRATYSVPCPIKSALLPPSDTGYPVSLGGNSADFIGHGTEYVARKGKDAFIVPFDTPATKKDPTLTGQRMQEASALGFFSEGGTYDEFARSMIKIHEGFKPKAYADQFGNMTIGYGHLLSLIHI